MRYKIRIQYFGGRGASLGKYHRNGKDLTYGDEYETVLEIDKFHSGEDDDIDEEQKTNYEFEGIKVLRIKEGSPTAPMETMTPNRIYATIDDDNEIKYVTFYNNEGMRYKQIDLQVPHKINGTFESPHVHLGYYHNENGDRLLNEEEKMLLDYILRKWDDYKVNIDKQGVA